MAIPLAGYNTAGAVNGAAVALTEWEVTPEVDDLDGTSTESGGFHQTLAGVVKCEITVTGFFDGALNPYTDLPDLQAGNLVTLSLSINANGNVGGEPFWLFPSAMVKSAQTKASVKDKVMFTAHLIGNGVFDYPAGDVL